MTTHTPTSWSAEVVHPDTGRVLDVDVLDAPDIRPSINALPEVRLPVRRDPRWLNPVFEGDPELRVWRDGVRQPIDVLRDVDHRPDGDRTVLVGVGGVELEQRVQKYYQAERRYDAAESLIQNETNYSADVDIPQASSDRQSIKTLDTTADFQNNLSTATDDPVNVATGEAAVAQTHFVEPFYQGNMNVVSGPFSLPTGSDFVGGEAFRFEDEGAAVEFNFTTQYDIPAGSLYVAFRNREPTDVGSVAIEVTVDGKSDFLGALGTGFEWDKSEIANQGGLPAGSHTVRFTYNSSSSSVDPEAEADVFTLYDDRFSYNFDNTLDGPSGHLDGPELYPPTTSVPTDDFASQFAIVGGKADAVVNTADPAAKLQLSNDSGANYSPTNGDEIDTNSVEVDFADDGSFIRSRVGLDRYGSRTGDTPKTGYKAQALDKLDIYADIIRLYLLLDEDRDASIAEILTYITADTRYLWSYQVDANGNGKVVFTQPGQRVASDAPDLVEANIQKSGTTYPKVTVKGSPKQISDEEFTASTTYVDLSEDALIGGTDTVRDPSTGEQFVRGSDYELDREAGEIRITAGSNMVSGDTYQITYQAEVSGTYTDPNAPADPRELVRQIPGVTTQQQAEQAGYVLVDELAEPRYAANVIVPQDRIGFDPAEALPLSELDLPDAATPLSVETDPEITPRGLRLRLGSRDTLEQALSRVREQLAAVSKRT